MGLGLVDDPQQLSLQLLELPALDQLLFVLHPALVQLESLLEESVPDALESERHPGVGHALHETSATLPGRLRS